MMKIISVFIAFSLSTLLSVGQKINPDYDSTLTRSFGADDYGMKNYVLVILKTGNATIDDRAIVDSLFSGHLQNIIRLADLGKLVIAGPLGKNDKNYRGIFILDVDSIDDAHTLLQTDPAISNNLLEPELFKWYGGAALSDYLKVQDKLGKYRF